jgi:DNA mismatch repair protein MutL
MEKSGLKDEKEETSKGKQQQVGNVKNKVEEITDVFEKQKPVNVSVCSEKIEQQKELTVLSQEKPTRLKSLDLTQTKIVGQLFSVYILLEGEKEIYLLDQHAAHEAFLAQELQQILDREERLPSQILMNPIPVKIRPRDIERIEMALNDYKKMGFDCDVFGSDTLLVRSVPVLMGEPQNTALLQVMIDENLFIREEGTVSDSVFTEKLKNRLITMACKAAIKGGQTLARDEIRKLLENLMELDNPYTCPHGRPIILRLKEYELMKLFKRVV